MVCCEDKSLWTVSCWPIRLGSVLKDKLCPTRPVTCIGSTPLTTGVILRPVAILRPVNHMSLSKVRDFWRGCSFSCEIHCGKQLLVWSLPAVSFAGTQGAVFFLILLPVLITSVKILHFSQKYSFKEFFSFKFLTKWLFAFKNPLPNSCLFVRVPSGTCMPETAEVKILLNKQERGRAWNMYLWYPVRNAWIIHGGNHVTMLFLPLFVKCSVAASSTSQGKHYMSKLERILPRDLAKNIRKGYCHRKYGIINSVFQLVFPKIHHNVVLFPWSF